MGRSGGRLERMETEKDEARRGAAGLLYEPSGSGEGLNPHFNPSPEIGATWLWRNRD